MRIAVHVDERPGVSVPVELVRSGVRAAFAAEGPAAHRGGHGDDRAAAAGAAISLAFLDDAGIRELHRRYLDRDRPTDVLAFGLHDEGEPVVGDVYVGLEQARRQADEGGVPLEEELLRLAIHGTLHVLGHEHPAGPERVESEMFRRQEALVRRVLAGEERTS